MAVSRRDFLVLGAAAVAKAQPNAGPVEIGCRRQLFIDEMFVERPRGVELQVNPPRKAGVVFAGEHPWESESIGQFSSVLEHDGVVKLWYVAHGEGGRLCLATSADGIHFRKEPLNNVTFRGDRRNNIVLDGFVGQGSVMRDPVAPPGERFKTMARYNMLGTMGAATEGGMMLLVSPDGIHWTREYFVLPFKADSPNCLFWDTRIQRYVAYLRGWAPLRVVVRCVIERDAILRSWPYKPNHQPFYLWRRFPGRDDWPPAISTELPVVMAADGDDPPGCDIYTSNAQPYPWAEGVYLAFPSVFRHTAPAGSEKVPMAGQTDVHLAVSRDGIQWHRLGRPYLALGMEGEPDSRQIYFSYGTIRRQNWLYHYYSALPYGHGERPRGGVLMRAEQRLDGFVSLSSRGEGEFRTPLLRSSGRRLTLNVDTSASGTVSVGLVDAHDRPLAGFTHADCDPIVANATSRVVRWRGGEGLPPISESPVRLHFRLRNARLFAFQLVN